jgi:hypothetical protein
MSTLSKRKSFLSRWLVLFPSNPEASQERTVFPYFENRDAKSGKGRVNSVYPHVLDGGAFHSSPVTSRLSPELRAIVVRAFIKSMKNGNKVKKTNVIMSR